MVRISTYTLYNRKLFKTNISVVHFNSAFAGFTVLSTSNETHVSRDDILLIFIKISKFLRKFLFFPRFCLKILDFSWLCLVVKNQTFLQSFKYSRFFLLSFDKIRVFSPVFLWNLWYFSDLLQNKFALFLQSLDEICVFSIIHVFITIFWWK